MQRCDVCGVGEETRMIGGVLTCDVCEDQDMEEEDDSDYSHYDQISQG